MGYPASRLKAGSWQTDAGRKSFVGVFLVPLSHFSRRSICRFCRVSSAPSLFATDSRPEDVVVLGFTILFISRSFVEIDFLNQYTIGSFLIYYAAGLIVHPMTDGQARRKAGRYAMSLRPV
jgi:O-antigen ligase